MKFIKVIKSRNEGTFSDGRGTWKKVLDKSVETEVLGVTFKIDVYHFETSNEEKNPYFQPTTKHFVVTNAEEVKKLLEDRINQEVANEIGEFEYAGGIYLTAPIEGQLK